MKKILVGSQAARIHFPDFRHAKDTDYLVDCDIEKVKGTEHKNITGKPGYSHIFNSCTSVATPEQLYTLKLGHCFWNIHWNKTMSDIRWFQKNQIQYDSELLTQLITTNTIIHGPKRAYLNKSNEDFFKDAIKRKYNHDDLHRQVAYYDEPMFEKIKKDRTKAMVSKEMFDNLDFEDRIKTCREEICVTALERCVIPGLLSPTHGYRKAICLLMTSMTKGWFPMFIALNWTTFCIPDEHYWEMCKLYQELEQLV